MEHAVESGELTKKHVKNRGYNKYLKVNYTATIEVDYKKFKEDAKWDGLKGYITNRGLPKEEVINQFGQLWHIEHTFRISKSDLRIRPIFHYRRLRIESPICIAFAACLVYKELERKLKERHAEWSPEKAINILKTIFKITIRTPYSNTKYSSLVLKTKEQIKLLKLFGF